MYSSSSEMLERSVRLTAHSFASGPMVEPAYASASPEVERNRYADAESIVPTPDR
jgi:hypothetical protein